MDLMAKPRSGPEPTPTEIERAIGDALRPHHAEPNGSLRVTYANATMRFPKNERAERFREFAKGRISDSKLGSLQTCSAGEKTRHAYRESVFETYCSSPLAQRHSDRPTSASCG